LISLTFQNQNLRADSIKLALLLPRVHFDLNAERELYNFPTRDLSLRSQADY
jgi:hypothetical protein